MPAARLRKELSLCLFYLALSLLSIQLYLLLLTKTIHPPCQLRHHSSLSGLIILIDTVLPIIASALGPDVSEKARSVCGIEMILPRNKAVNEGV